MSAEPFINIGNLKLKCKMGCATMLVIHLEEMTRIM